MFKNFSGVLPYISKRNRNKFWAIVVLKCFVGLLDLLAVTLIALVAAIATTQLSTTSDVLKSWTKRLEIGTQELVFYLLLFVVLLYLIKGLLATWFSKLLANLTYSIEANNSERLISYFYLKNYSHFTSISRSEMQWIVVDSNNQATSVHLMSLASIFSDGFVLIAISVLFFIVDPVLSCFALLYLLLIGLVLQKLIGKSLAKTSQNIAESANETIVKLDNLSETYKESFVTRTQMYFLNDLVKSRSQLGRGKSNQLFLLGLPKSVVETSLMIGLLIFISVQFLSGSLANSAAVIGVFLAGGVRMMGAAIPVQNSITALKSSTEQGTAAINILKKIHDEPNVLYSSSPFQNTKTPKPAAAVELFDVDFAYDTSISNVLTGINLRIEHGQFAALIGPSGSGKTTLVDVILGLLTPTSGRVEICGNQFSELSTFSVAYVPQKPGIITGTIAQNITLGENLTASNQYALRDAASQANILAFIDSLDQGFNTLIGSGNLQLSGGQLQRIGIARALYRTPTLLILDEATSALDAESEYQITSSIESLKGKVTCLVIAHRLSTVQRSDCVYLLEDGEIVDYGSFADLQDSSALVQTYVDLMKIENQ